MQTVRFILTILLFAIPLATVEAQQKKGIDAATVAAFAKIGGEYGGWTDT